jgi:acyl-coenzyme A thioesterase PaaI-like protein
MSKMFCSFMDIARMYGTDMLPFDTVLVGNTTLPSTHGGMVAGFMYACLQNRVRFAAPGSAVKTMTFTTEFLKPVGLRDLAVNVYVKRQGRRIVAVCAAVW